MAQQKLGIKRLDEIPSISELGELLGTSNAGDTIKYMRYLTSTDQGIALIKAYIESSDYTDSTAGAAKITNTNPQQEDNTEAKLEDLSSKSGFLERLYAYLNPISSPPQSRAISNSETLKSTLDQQREKLLPALSTQPNPAPKPLYVRNPLPYHYPIPLRPHPMPVAAIRQNTAPSSSAVHLNSPKAGLPAHLQLAKLADIPPKQLQRFLQQQPKLAELASKVSRFPLTQPQASAMHAQFLAAVEQAIAQDEDLRKLLSSVTETLK